MSKIVILRTFYEFIKLHINQKVTKGCLDIVNRTINNLLFITSTSHPCSINGQNQLHLF